MGLMSDEQGHCLKTGAYGRGSPGAQVGDLGPWEELISFAQMLDVDANKPLLKQKLLSCPCAAHTSRVWAHGLSWGCNL